MRSVPYDDRTENDVAKANEAATARLLELLREHHRPDAVRNGL
jgi:hypothetical protein